MALLEVQQITKKFAGITALDQVSMELEKGTVTALIGENGAGKSTLLKIMSGIYPDYEGDILLKGKKIQFNRPKEAQLAGIGIIHQELNLIPNLTVVQNIFLGRELVDSLGLLNEKAMHELTSELLKRLQSKVNPTALVSSLHVGQQQVVEIAKALLDQSEILFMDEPTSAIGESEVNVLFQLINTLKAAGKSIVYISHKLDELFAIADHYVVLRDGKLVGSGAMKSINREQLIELMAGRKVRYGQRVKRQVSNELVLEVQDMYLKNHIRGKRPLLQKVSFGLKKGEVLGIYGLMGAGRTELCECLFGLHDDGMEGCVRLDGVMQTFKSPRDAIERGMALVPEDRKRDGIVPAMSVAENISLADMGKIEKAGVIFRSKELALFQKHVSSLRIKVSDGQQPIQNLSGGNQQKAILARWIERNLKVLILDEPTRGIDINAKSEIYELIGQLSESGVAVLMVSSEIPEIMTVADRILVMAEGRISATFERADASEKDIMSACIPEN